MDPGYYTYPSPLEGYENLPKLPDEKAADGKSLVNPPSAAQSSAYAAFPPPLDNGIRGGFDIHVYFLPTSPSQTAFATALWERIHREFPELRIYPIFHRPVGPHPVGMFEVNLFTPHQFGAFVSWLVIARGPLSVLVHPNTGDAYRDHTQRASWLGASWPLNMDIMRTHKEEVVTTREVQKDHKG